MVAIVILQCNKSLLPSAPGNPGVRVFLWAEYSQALEDVGLGWAEVKISKRTKVTHRIQFFPSCDTPGTIMCVLSNDCHFLESE